MAVNSDIKLVNCPGGSHDLLSAQQPPSPEELLKNDQFNGSPAGLVKKAHLQGVLKTIARSGSHFSKHVHRSAIPESPKWILVAKSKIALTLSLNLFNVEREN